MDLFTLLADSDHLSRYTTPKTKAKSEWAQWVGAFTDELNKDRGGYKPLTNKRVAKLLAPFKKDIEYFWGKCYNSKSFGRTFWYHANPKLSTGYQKKKVANNYRRRIM